MDKAIRGEAALSLAVLAGAPSGAGPLAATSLNAPLSEGAPLGWRGAGVRFVSGGGACFAVNLAILWVATEWWKWHYLAAFALSWGVSLVLGFALHRRWTFRSRSADVAGEAWRYLTVNLGQAGVSAGLMAVLVSGLGIAPWLASVAIAAVLTGATFLLHLKWSFAR